MTCIRLINGGREMSRLPEGRRVTYAEYLAEFIAALLDIVEAQRTRYYTYNIAHVFRVVFGRRMTVFDEKTAEKKRPVFAIMAREAVRSLGAKIPRGGKPWHFVVEKGRFPVLEDGEAQT